MSLPILNVKHEAGVPELVRYFHKAQRLWTEHMSPETEQLDIGTAFFNPSLPNVFDANCIFDAALPAGTSADDAIRIADAFYQQKGLRCQQWAMNPSAARAQTEPLVQFLLGSGYTTQTVDILHLSHVATLIKEVGGLTIIPARASFKYTRALAEEANRQWGEPQLVEAEMSHLDDPHWEALIALADRKPVARVGVLAVGEIGMIEPLFVSEPFRRQGIGRTMLSRALEICARSLFKHVLIGVSPDNDPAKALYSTVGFRKIGEFTEYMRPS
jgi:ribosomal protein S18 acetylase RimI-like enzyme